MNRLTSLLRISRWDSSDPDRAPPPLPLNPGTNSPATKPNTSASVAAAAEAFVAKARESAYTTNPSPQRSPEKSLIKGQYHKRLQSFQNGDSNARDLSTYLDYSKSPERSPTKSSRSSAFDHDKSSERSPSRSETPTPLARDLGKDPASLRSIRPPPRPILTENTPPSSTMLALQSIPTPKDMDSGYSSFNNNASSIVRTPQTFDAISSQILSLTSIATNLQREMAQLSRRSKDNATDLISLKEATNARDEDIRKSLRELVSSVSSRMLDTGSSNHYVRGPGAFLLDSKPHVSPSGMAKSVSLPRIPSPNSFSATLERELANSSSPYHLEGAASIALLEKILREMGTKAGQERLITSLSELSERPNIQEADPAVVKKLEEILNFLKDSTGSRALVTRRDNGNGVGDKPPQLDLDFENARPLPLARTTRDITPRKGQLSPANTNNILSNPKATDFVTDDIVKLLKRMKDSITESGGMSAEIKALVRELRGEVLGMGREIGRKLEQAETSHGQINDRGDAHGPGREEIVEIVENGLSELKEHMDQIMRERRRQSSASSASRSSVDGQEIYHAVKNALSEMPMQQQVAVQHPESGIGREEILEAVREAWENYKPEIELQNFGLERDEILHCLKEGLQHYQPQDQSKDLGGATYEEVLDAVKEGLNNFKPPAVETEANITKEEILTTVRDCLESFEFPSSNVGAVGLSKESDITREDVLDAVKEGLSTQVPVSKEIEFNRDDLFDAVRAGLEGAPTPMGGVGEQVLEKMQELADGMKLEFKQYSAANGGDTEQVLDAMKDGLEVLRADIESYVDRAADVTGKDEIIDTLRHGMDSLRNDLEASIANVPRAPENTNNGEMLDAMEKEFEHLRQTIATSLLRSGDSNGDKDDVLDAIRDGLEDMKKNMPKSVGSDQEAMAIMREELERLRESLATTLVPTVPAVDREELLHTIKEGLDSIRVDIVKPPARAESILSNTSEVLDAFNEGLDGLRADVEKIVNKPVDMTLNYEILDTLKHGLNQVRADIDRLHAAQEERAEVDGNRGGQVVIAEAVPLSDTESLRRNDIENLEIMITQLRIKVEALDNLPPPVPQAAPRNMDSTPNRETLEGIEILLQGVQTSLHELAERDRGQDANTATKGDTEAIENILRNTKAKLDEMVFPEPEGMARTEHLDAVEAIVTEIRDAMVDVATRLEPDAASKTDVGILEVLLKEIQAGLADLREKGLSSNDEAEKICKADIEALETLCMDTNTRIAEMVLPDAETLPTKASIEMLGGLVVGFKEKVEAEASLTAQAFEARKIEHGGIADKIEDVRVLLKAVREELTTKLANGETSVDGISSTLKSVNDFVVADEAHGAVKELMDIVIREFERSHGHAQGAKAESEQNHALLLEKHEEHKGAIISELISKVDARFDELMMKYDDAQLAAEEKEKMLGTKDAEQRDALYATKSAAEDLKVLIDTLGATVTDSCERMGEDSKTVYNQIEDIGAKTTAKIDELASLLPPDQKADHQLTRGEISKTLTGVEGVQAYVAEYEPKILIAVNEVLAAVGQHYDHARASSEELKDSVRAIPGAIEMPALPPPLPSPAIMPDIPFVEKYDDTEIHAKLDKLVEHVAEAGKSAAEFHMLDQIREQVASTADDLSAFISNQQAKLAETQGNREREAEELAIAIEKRFVQKESVESDITRLSEEKQNLENDVRELLREKEELAIQKAKMNGDLSSLMTALQIRREELHVMEARADGLERRILDGVLDHSRSLLMTSRPQSSLKEMNLKRVVSATSNAITNTRTSIGTTIPPTPSAISSGIGMALKRRQPPRNANTSNSPGKLERRILSLSTIGANKASNNQRSMVLADPGAGSKASGFGGGLKRSHSVKSNFPVRKTSWGGTKALGLYADEGDEGGDKENSILDEEDEEGSDAGTERRTSYTGTATDRVTSYGSAGTGTRFYGDESLAGDEDRRMSYEASTVGTVGFKNEDDEEERNRALDERGEGLAPTEGKAEAVKYGGSDSGIGTDIPTAALEGGSDYFKREG